MKGSQYDVSNIPENEKIFLENPDGVVVCPEYWCMKDNIPLSSTQLEDEKCPVCGNKIRKTDKEDPRTHTVIKREEGFKYPGFIDYKSPGTGKEMPCCYKKPQKGKILEEDKYYITGEAKDVKSLRLSFISESILNSLNLIESYDILKTTKRIQSGMSGYFRVGIGIPSDTIPTLLNIRTKIPDPKDAISSVIQCSFFRSWNRLEDETDEIISSLKKVWKSEDTLNHVAKIIAGIQSAFEKNELTFLDNLEYTCVCLQIDVFRIIGNSLACMFYTPIVRPRSRGIILLDKTVISFVNTTIVTGKQMI